MKCRGGGHPEGGHPEIDILIYALQCMMFQAVRNERAHGSVGRRCVQQLTCRGFDSHECHCKKKRKNGSAQTKKFLGVQSRKFLIPRRQVIPV
jgi:hypothetical protein